MTYDPSPASMRQVSEMILGLYEVAAATARVAARQGRKLLPRSHRNETLRPGAATPLWNELLRQAQPFLKKRGSKARLARLMGLPRQRLHDCLKAQNACLDAERTLLLLCWITAQRDNRELTA